MSSGVVASSPSRNNMASRLSAAGIDPAGASARPYDYRSASAPASAEFRRHLGGAAVDLDARDVSELNEVVDGGGTHPSARVHGDTIADHHRPAHRHTAGTQLGLFGRTACCDRQRPIRLEKIVYTRGARTSRGVKDVTVVAEVPAPGVEGSVRRRHGPVSAGPLARSSTNASTAAAPAAASSSVSSSRVVRPSPVI
jgi:hypothetical protein